jgi:hypothetical protein
MAGPGALMLTGELRNQIDGIWNDFWSGGLSNPLQVIEQITYLIFIKRLDEMQELEERKATTLGKPIERRIFPEGKDERGEPYANLRWSRFKHFAAMVSGRRQARPGRVARPSSGGEIQLRSMATGGLIGSPVGLGSRGYRGFTLSASVHQHCSGAGERS